jgi:flagellar assembly protein FliH
MANVLKSHSISDATDAARAVSGLAGFNLNDLADEGRARLDQCREAVQKMLADAAVEAEQLRIAADARGYQEGLDRAAVDADKKLKAEADRLAKKGLQSIGDAVTQLHRTYDAWMQVYSQKLIAIALASAERIVRQKLTEEPAILVRWAEEALTSTRTATKLVLAVHPETLATLGEALDQMLAAPDLPEQTHVEPDESLARDSVVVRQVGGDISAGLDAQLDRLAEMLS